MTNRCENCSAYFRISDEHGQCRAESPKAFVVGVQQGRLQASNGARQAIPMVVAAFPEVAKDLCCREFEPRPAA